MEISGNTGTADDDTNRFVVLGLDGRVYGRLYDDSDVNHEVYSAVDPVDFPGTFTVKFFVDLTDMSNMDLWINQDNSGMTKSNNSGTATFDTTDTMVRIGQNYVAFADSSCYISNVRVQPYEF